MQSIENVAAVFYQIFKTFRMKTNNYYCRYFWSENLSYKIELLNYKIIGKVRYSDRCFKSYIILIVIIQLHYIFVYNLYFDKEFS